MKRLLIAGLAAVAMVNSAWAADSCEKVDNITDADTATCVVRVDGRVVLNEKRCAVTNSRAGRDWSAGAYDTLVEIGPLDDPQHPNSRARLNEALWNKGTDEDHYTSLGPVEADEHDINLVRYHNRRFDLRLSHFMFCNSVRPWEDSLARETDFPRQMQEINACYLEHKRESLLPGTDAGLRRCMREHGFDFCGHCEVNGGDCRLDGQGAHHPECYRDTGYVKENGFPIPDGPEPTHKF